MRQKYNSFYPQLFKALTIITTSCVFSQFSSQVIFQQPDPNFGVIFAALYFVNEFRPGGSMLKIIFAPALVSALLILAACSSHNKKKIDAKVSEVFPPPVTQEVLDKTTANWPLASTVAIRSLTTKYGLPTSVTDEMVVWTNSGPFKRSVIYKEEVTHQFPKEHSDILQQTIDYRVPKEKIAQLFQFDGSLIVDRTKGELSARNERQEMNILSLNLADRIIRGEVNVEEARREYGRNAEAFAAGSEGPIMTQFFFKAQGNTSDPDMMMQSQEDLQGHPRAKRFNSKSVEKAIEDQE
jgi:hypothetical protein